MSTYAKISSRYALACFAVAVVFASPAAFAGMALAMGPGDCPDAYAEIGAAKFIQSKADDAVQEAVLRSKSRVEALQKEVAKAYGAKGEALIGAVKRELYSEIESRRRSKELDPTISSANGVVFDIDKNRRELALLTSTPLSTEDGEEFARAVDLARAVENYDSVILAQSSRPELSEAAEFLNRIFQSKELIYSFSEESILRALLVGKRNPERRAFIERWLANPNSVFSRPWRGDIITALVSMGRRDGWRGAVDIRPGVEFMEASIQQRRLPRDLGNRKSTHTQDAHLFQLVLATRLLTEEFGSEKAWELISFLGTKEGQGYWNFLIDRGPGHQADLRGPAFMSKYHGLQDILELD